VILGLDLVALLLCVGYWESRYQTEGWGRGWMRPVPRHRRNRFPQSYPEVWDDPWEFDIYLPSVEDQDNS
jgi:hypothetical protein